MRLFWTVLVIAGIAIVAMSAYQFLARPDAGDPAPAFELPALDGGTVSLERYSSKPVLLHFWASWCGICRFTTPDVARLQSEGESVMTIALRSGNDGEVSRWLSRKRVTFPVVNDSGGEISRNWEISVTPTLVVVSKGQVVTTTSGWTSYWGMKLRLWRAAMF